MTETDTVTLTRSEYQALIARTEELEDALAAREADDGSRIPHEVALAIMGGRAACTGVQETSRHDAARSGGSNRDRCRLSVRESNAD